MAAERSHRFNRLLASLAGWLGRSRQRTATRSAVVSAPLVMVGSPMVKGQPSVAAQRTGRACAAVLPPAGASSILIVPLPVGLGWSNDALASLAADDDMIEEYGDLAHSGDGLLWEDELHKGAGILVDAALVHTPSSSRRPPGRGDDIAVRRLSSLQARAAAPAASAAFVVARSEVASSEVAPSEETPSEAAAPSIATQPRPCLLARQLRGVARLNHPSARHNGKKLPPHWTQGLTAIAKPHLGRRAPLRRAAPPRTPQKLPVAQPWILARSATR